MLIITDSQSSGSLSVLPQIPDFRAVLIEGRNGIGKTMLVRLLELIAGKQPFAAQAKSWMSLRERLGPTTVTLTGLHDDRSLQVLFTPDAWPVDPVPLVIGEWLGDVYINGEPAAVVDAQEMLWVERFAGNEDLDRTLRRRLDIYADRVSRTHRHVAATMTSITDLLGPLTEQLRPLDPARLREQQAQLAAAENGEIESRQQQSEAIARHESILAAVDSANRVAAAGNPTDELAFRRSEIQAQIAAAAHERDETQGRVDTTAERLAREGNAQSALADAERIQRHRAKRLRKLESDAERQAHQLNVEPALDAVRDLLEEAREHIAHLRAERAALDSSGQTARLIDRLDGLLVSADAEGLDEQELAVMREQRFSVREVHAGMRARADELRGKPLPDELQAIDRALAEARRRGARLNTLLQTLNDLARQRQLLQQADDEVGAALARAQTAGTLDEAFRTDAKRLGQLEEQIDQLGRELASVYEQMGLQSGQSLEDAHADLYAALNALTLPDPGDLPAAESAARLAVEQATAAVTAAVEQAASLRRSVTVVQAAISGALSTLASDPLWGWLATSSVPAAPDALERFAQGRARLLRLEQRLDDADRLLDSFKVVADAALNAEDAMIGDAPHVKALRRVLGEELRVFLDTPAIRTALFDGDQVTHVDPVEGELTVQGADGPITRPFQSFSTGEQAFAFTQARIRELEPPAQPNRLLVLDEFGAFVAADRLPLLIDFLADEALGAICDQVLVILPLQVDYAADLEYTTGTLADRYEDRARQIAECGYCAVPLDE
jgi:hypothetical protein